MQWVDLLGSVPDLATIQPHTHVRGWTWDRAVGAIANMRSVPTTLVGGRAGRRQTPEPCATPAQSTAACAVEREVEREMESPPWWDR